MHLLKRYALLIGLLIGLFVTPFLLHASERLRADRNFIEEEESFSIFLDSRDINNNQATLDLSDYNYNPPSECDNEDVVCFESSVITVHVKKIWEVATILPLTHESLEADVFSASYPDIESTSWEELRSNPEELMIAQRTLYERGLMDVLPTGQYGYITEQAVAHLQGLKDIEEIDWGKGQVVIGPATIVQINELKSRIIVPFYTQDNPLPQNYEEVLSPALAKRSDRLDQLIPQYSPSQDQKNAVEGNIAEIEGTGSYDMKPDGTQLQFHGEATIQK